MKRNPVRPAKPYLHSPPTVGIITALPKEYAAVEALLENCHPYTAPGEGAGREYLIGEVPSARGGQHTVVLALSDMGQNSSAIRATRMLNHFTTATDIIMVGIAGGIPNPTKPDSHVRLGDIVVSGQGGVVQYDFVAETVSEQSHRHPPRPASARLIEAASLLDAGELLGRKPWLTHIKRSSSALNVLRPPVSKDVLASTDNPERRVRHPRDVHRSAGEPRVFRGTIASANRLLKNPKLRDQLRDRFGAKAVEMEASGIADATWTHDVGYLVVRGICDYCDAGKGDAWQAYATVAAAGYTRALLESIPAFSKADGRAADEARPQSVPTSRTGCSRMQANEARLTDLIYQQPPYLRIFLSSRLDGEAWHTTRAEAIGAIEELGACRAWASERDMMSGDYKRECLGHARTSDGLLLILASDLTTMTCLEYRAAKKVGRALCILVDQNGQPSPQMRQFIEKERRRGTFVATFATQHELRTRITSVIYAETVRRWRLGDLGVTVGSVQRRTV